MVLLQMDQFISIWIAIKSIEGDKDMADEIDQAEFDVAFRTVRELADESNFGKYISDEDCRKWATRVVEAIEAYKKGDVI